MADVNEIDAFTLNVITNDTKRQHCASFIKIHTVQRSSSPIDSNTHVKEYQFSLSAGRKCHKHSMLMYDNTILVKVAINDPKKSAIILVFTLFLCGWSRKLAPTSQSIRYKTEKKENH